MDRCIFTVIIPVGFSEDQDWSQLTGRLRVGPVSGILQNQGLSDLYQSLFYDQHWHGAMASRAFIC